MFTLPPELFDVLKNAAPAGFVFLREDEDVLTISAEKMNGSRRRQLNHTYKALSFRSAILLSVVNIADTLQLMPVEWRKRRLTPSQPPPTR